MSGEDAQRAPAADPPAPRSPGLSGRLLQFLEREAEAESRTPQVVLAALGTTAALAFGLAFYRSLRKHRPPPVAQMLVEAEPHKVREGRGSGGERGEGAEGESRVCVCVYV